MKQVKLDQQVAIMLLLSAMALGLVESANPIASGGGSSSTASSSSSSGGGSVATVGRDTANDPIIVGGINGQHTITTYDNGTFKTTAGDWSIIEQCLSWRRPNHLYFQLGNAFFFLAFLAPNGSYGMLWLRCALVIGCILLTMWGWLIECTGDVVLWSCIFLVTNLIYLIVLLCRLRPVRFDKEIEAVSLKRFFF